RDGAHFDLRKAPDHEDVARLREREIVRGVGCAWQAAVFDRLLLIGQIDVHDRAQRHRGRRRARLVRRRDARRVGLDEDARVDGTTRTSAGCASVNADVSSPVAATQLLARSFVASMIDTVVAVSSAIAAGAVHDSFAGFTLGSRRSTESSIAPAVSVVTMA